MLFASNRAVEVELCGVMRQKQQTTHSDVIDQKPSTTPSGTVNSEKNKDEKISIRLNSLATIRLLTHLFVHSLLFSRTVAVKL